ncbi:MAG: ABC transporter ATP-binding protein [Rhodothermales bacterium]
MEQPPLISVHNLTKSFEEGDSKRTVLEDVNFQIGKGEFVVMFGRSGSGKSTLLNVLSGIDLPTAGSVTMGGTNLTTLSEQERTLFRREHIGFVFQAFNLIPTLTVEENVLLPLDLNKRMGKQDVQDALAFLTKVGLGDRMGSYPDRLSGGEQQRVAIARALAHDPMLILADEPTGNLDDDTANQVLEVFDTLVRRMGKTTLVATHDRSMAALADRVFTLQGGHIVSEKAGATIDE